MIIYDAANDKMVEVVPTSYTLKKRFNIVQDDLLVFRHSHIAITNYTMGDNPEFEKALSVWDETRYKYKRVMGHYIKELKEFRVPRSFDTAILKQHFPNRRPIVENDAYPAKKIDIKLLTPPRDDEQRVGLAFLCSQGDYKRNYRYTTLMLDMTTGSGKAQPDDTPIPTYTGMKLLKDLEIGEYVFNLDGQPVQVANIYPQGVQDTYEITVGDGRTTRCNLEHLWYARPITRSDYGIYTLKDIIELHTTQDTEVRIPRPGAVEFAYVRVADPYATMRDLAVANESDAYVPDEYKYNCTNYRRLALRGLLTDASIDTDFHLVTVIFKSRKLCEDIVDMARSLGFDATLVDFEMREYGVGIRCLAGDVKVLLPDKAEDAFKDLSLIAKWDQEFDDELVITDIRKVEPTPQRCIAINDPLFVYITENYIPTHNTYTMSAASCFLQAKSVVIVPFSALLEQWEAAYVDHTSLTKDDILIVASEGTKKSSQDTCLDILDGVYDDKKVFIFMIDSLVAFQKKYGNLKTIELLRATGAYVKIMDEIHREFTAMGMIDALSNFHMNYYASATPDRSQRKEKWIFRTVYRNCPRFGQNFKVEAEKWTNIVIARYSFTPTPQQIKRMVNPRKGWLNTKAYEKELLYAPDEQIANFRIVFRNVMKWSKSQLKKGNKILILCATIDGTAVMQEWAEEFFPGETARHYGTMKKKDKDEARKKTVICATSQSLGTGADIKGIQHVYNIETYTTSINAGQLPGRARKIEGVQVFYVEFVNMSYVKTYRQFEAHKPYLIKTSKTGKLIMLE